jgi:hypothetical protein
MWEQITDEAFLKPALTIGALGLLLISLRKINKVLLIVGIVVLGVLYFTTNRPPWLESIWQSFQL